MEQSRCLNLTKQQTSVLKCSLFEGNKCDFTRSDEAFGLMGKRSARQRQASPVVGLIDKLGRKRGRSWVAACWGLVVAMSGDSQNNGLASATFAPPQHPVAILARRLFLPESRERR